MLMISSEGNYHEEKRLVLQKLQINRNELGVGKRRDEEAG